MKVITVSIVCKEKDVEYVKDELLNLQLGVYSLGTTIEDASEKVVKEVEMMVPSDILEEYLELKKYGLSFKTIHDDSSYHDKHELWFSTEEERNQTYENWKNELHWDAKNNIPLKYPTPSPNYYHKDTIKIEKCL